MFNFAHLLLFFLHFSFQGTQLLLGLAELLLSFIQLLLYLLVWSHLASCFSSCFTDQLEKTNINPHCSCSPRSMGPNRFHKPIAAPCHAGLWAPRTGFYSVVQSSSPGLWSCSSPQCHCFLFPGLSSESLFRTSGGQQTLWGHVAATELNFHSHWIWFTHNHLCKVIFLDALISFLLSCWKLGSDHLGSKTAKVWYKPHKRN